ncbi:MAG: hypothetical protein CL943_01385 [Candidatus Diapherotrites archaeon]|uniref:Uncharacterized protein n=1 Tax=Candidatus Iainarchaeum sp. TaxID=3101447 RepID=A0A2D6M0K3_9ARCH|nr:hypothetical protein [Candidatus Diapherotrites archaeon]|tara:strand:+ start:4148 stop:4687 length:540 start_codon:yes stop_codon:yes gene_type:complete
MIKIDKQKVSVNKLPIGLFLIELVDALLVVYLISRLIGFEVQFETRSISINPVLDLTLLFFLAVTIVMLVAVYFVIKKRQPEMFLAQTQASSTIKDKTKEKLSKVKQDPRAAALLLIQFLFVFAVVITLVAWFDPVMEIIPWSEQGIGPPLSTSLNAVIAIVGLALFYYLYSFTAWYRK